MTQIGILQAFQSEVFVCVYFGSRAWPSAESLGSLRLFSYSRVFQTFKWSWKNAAASQVIFLSRPRPGGCRGDRNRRRIRTNVPPAQRTRAPLCRPAPPAPDGFPIRAPQSPLETSSRASLSRQPGPGTHSPFLSVVSVCKLFRFQDSPVSWPWFGSEASCATQRYLQSADLPSPWLSSSSGGDGGERLSRGWFAPGQLTLRPGHWDGPWGGGVVEGAGLSPPS